MKAIVLSFDKQIGFCELLYKSYMEKWPDCPLTFLVPWNNKKPEFFRDKKNVHLIKCEKSIRATMYALLNDIPDEDWVYWCIDDRYPIRINNPDNLTAIYNYLKNNPTPYNALKLFRWKEARDKTKDIITLCGDDYFIQEPRSFWGQGHHQFCRALVLKKVYLSDKLPVNYGPYAPGAFFPRLGALDFLENTLVPRTKNPVLFGEPCIARLITGNGYRDLLKYDCEIPPYNVTHDRDKTFIHKDIPSEKEAKRKNG